MLNSQTGSDNVALGANALYSNTTGSQNVGIGTQAGQRSKGDGNIFIGYKAGVNEVGDNKLYIDNNHAKMFRSFTEISGKVTSVSILKVPESALSIDSKSAKYKWFGIQDNLNSNSPAEKSNLRGFVT